MPTGSARTSANVSGPIAQLAPELPQQLRVLLVGRLWSLQNLAHDAGGRESREQFRGLLALRLQPRDFPLKTLNGFLEPGQVFFDGFDRRRTEIPINAAR